MFSAIQQWNQWQHGEVQTAAPSVRKQLMRHFCSRTLFTLEFCPFNLKQQEFFFFLSNWKCKTGTDVFAQPFCFHENNGDTVSWVIWKTSVSRMTRNYHSETARNNTRAIYSVRHGSFSEEEDESPSHSSSCFWQYRLSELAYQKASLKWDVQRERPYLMLKCVFRVFEVRYDWLEFIHKFIFSVFLPVLRLKNCSHYVRSQMAKKLWDQLLKYGKIPLLSFWLIAVICCVCISWEHIAIILTETTQQKHWPLLSVYCIMGVTRYLSPILRSLTGVSYEVWQFYKCGARTRIASDMLDRRCSPSVSRPLPFSLPHTFSSSASLAHSLKPFLPFPSSHAG